MDCDKEKFFSQLLTFQYVPLLLHTTFLPPLQHHTNPFLQYLTHYAPKWVFPLFSSMYFIITIGTPIIAVESGIVEALGWNQYGGWRIGIRSFDNKRYYYYAHLRKNYPYQSNLEVGSRVQAGDVIGYMGRTGYSRKENTNNIDESHLHFGIQLIFDESQKEGNNEIWISCYELVKFLRQNQCLTQKIPDTKEWQRVYKTEDK